LDHFLIGPFFIDGNLNSEIYEIILIKQIIPVIQNLLPLRIKDKISKEI